VILLNKTDLVSADELKAVEAAIHRVNPYARIHRTRDSAVPLDAILNKGAFDLQRILDLEPEFLTEEHDHAHHGHDHDDHGHGHGHDHHDHDHHDHDHDHHDDHKGHGTNLKVLAHDHDPTIKSISVVVDGEVDPKKFQTWISGILQGQGQNVLRSKGILAVTGEAKRYVFQAVHMIMDSTWGQEWKAGEPRRSKMVFIGRDLDMAALERGFRACAA